MVNFITEVLSPDDRCVCVFTEQEGLQKNLVLDEDGLFKSGLWKLDELDMLGVNKVVVYYRHSGMNKIIIGDYKRISPTIFRDHYCIHFQIANIDHTLTNWNDFCNAGENSVKYYRQD
ncbi:hypothetical protein SAMN04489760_10113 [Syntrophus gentianae]|uniref:Uncharacterized protein n=1 Tax=Syntrophus gentianae TaxID=43775 RepID=A0A1H7U7Q5_9BACT|nr:hypothetical protein SAMN04489760_10113 [Syntrophus gentianae]